MLASFDRDLSRLFFAFAFTFLVAAPLGGLLMLLWVRLLRKLFALALPKPSVTQDGPISVKATLYTRPAEPMPQQAIETTTASVRPRPRVSHTRRGDH
jgi:hypothetical protein